MSWVSEASADRAGCMSIADCVDIFVLWVSSEVSGCDVAVTLDRPVDTCIGLLGELYW